MLATARVGDVDVSGPEAARSGRAVEREGLEQAVRRLAAIERGSASAGEARAALVLAEMLGRTGLDPVLEHETAAAGFWPSTGAAAAAGAVAGLIGGRRRWSAALLGAAAAAAMADDVDNGSQLLRRVLPRGTTTNVLAWAGDPAAQRTVVLVAHHDAAHTGVMFHPGLVPAVARRFPRWYERQNTSVQTGLLLTAGPALAAAGAALGVRPLRRLGTLWCTVTAALLADVARSPVVAGANDNLSAVAVLLALAGRLAARPLHGVRVLLLSTGSEETFMEGMRGFMRRHTGELDPAGTCFLALECVGSPHLTLLEGEGMLVMRDYDSGLREELQAAADAAGVPMWRGLRLGAGATDALPAMRAGYRTACLAAVTELKTPANYHWPSDVPENLCWETIEGAVEVVDSFLRRAAQPAPDSAASSSDRARA